MNASELILNSKGGIYHLALQPEQLTDIVLTVGDPERVPLVAQYLDSIDYIQAHREFAAMKGVIHGREVLVLSTGMGTDNIDIVMNELDILANVDLLSRSAKKIHRRLSVIRLGTSGSLQDHIQPGDIVFSEYAVGFDLLSAYYGIPSEWANPTQKLNQFVQKYQLQAYFTACGPEMKAHFSPIFPAALTLTLPGFYAPQGRNIRLQATIPDVLKIYQDLRVNNKVPDNIEMETSGYYLLGRWMGHECISINAILANRLNGTFHPDPEAVVITMIEKVLDSLRHFNSPENR